MAILSRISGSADESVRSGAALTEGNTATLRNGPRSILVRFLATDAGTVDLETYDLELAPYERYTWTVGAADKFVAIAAAPFGEMRHPRNLTAHFRAALDEVAAG